MTLVVSILSYPILPILIVSLVLVLNIYIEWVFFSLKYLGAGERISQPEPEVVQYVAHTTKSLQKALFKIFFCN